MKKFKNKFISVLMATMLCGSCSNPIDSDSNIIDSILDNISEYLSESYTSEEISSIKEEISDILDSSAEKESNTPDDIKVISVANALKIASKLENGQSTNTKYYVKGEVTNLYNTTYGNCYIKDSEGNELLIYGSYSSDGNTRYDSMDNKFKEGDTVIFYGPLTNYYDSTNNVNKYEIKDALTIAINDSYYNDDSSDSKSSEDTTDSEKEVPSEDGSASKSEIDSLDITSIKDAISIAAALENGESTTKKYYLLGEVTNLYNTTYGNCYIKDSEGNEFQIYGSYSSDGKTRYDKMEHKFEDGDDVVFYGTLKNYYDSKKSVNKYEIENAWTIAINGTLYENIIADNTDTSDINSEDTKADDTPIYADAEGWTNTDFGNYYNTISLDDTGTELLSSLRTLNNSKRKKTVGYSGLWNYFDQTDYDPSNKSQYIAFYQGTSSSKGAMNKEHVWPKSRGGNLVDGDLHMTRPTLTKDNSSRGNSFYVEGKNSSSNGWDPKAAGMKEQYRGQAARIIFYCVVASSQLSLVDKENDDTSNKTMGKLSDLLKWNLEYDVVQTELNRNNGAQNVQGNRNPFIDNPGLACAIWRNTNSTTKSICSKTK